MRNNYKFELPPEQQAIHDKCFHPSGTCVEAPVEDVETSIPARFEKIARMYPGRIAVKMGERSLTYDELNRYANRIARALVEKRGPNAEPIALLFEHGIDVITAIFGVLKAGKFYVALDPSNPLERITHIFQDSQTGLIVANKRNIDFARRLVSDSAALLKSDEINASYSSDNLGLSVGRDDLAMITYTSGSTGEPKGAIREHGTFLRRVLITAHDIAFRDEERSSLLHPVSLGAGNDDVFRSLLNGASLFLFDVKTFGVHRLARWLEDEDITACHLPHAIFHELVDSLSGEQTFPRLRLIRLSGAPVNRTDFDLYKRTFCPRTSLMITMGTTEIGRICAAVVDQTFSFPKQGAPAGYPIRGLEVLLLDDRGCEVAPNEVGEIAVRGHQLHSGYWRKPKLNDLKFLPDPNGGDGRIYLTGDLGKMLSDNFLLHLGRKDLMIKIRGYRVDMGEVERGLLAHPLVKDAAVAAWDREPGEKSIVGYVVPHIQPSPPPVDELNSYLRAKLPDYMIPTAYVFLEALPLTNGKLDRKALPLPGRDRPVFAQRYVAAQSESEQKLVEIWQEALCTQPIGIHDNFFDLGGHSLIAMRILSSVNDVFAVDVSMTNLLEFPTIAGLAHQIEESRRDETSKNNKITELLNEIEKLSEDEAQKQLALIDNE